MGLTAFSDLNSSRSVYCKSADQTEIYAEARGDPSRPALVFIHGFSLSSLVWDEIFVDPKWVEQAYLVRYDVRGHGRSGKPVNEEAWQSARLAQDFQAVVSEFRLHKPFIVGWSLGATNVADILSFTPPSSLSGLVFIAAVPFMGPGVGLVGTECILSLLPALMQTTNVDDYQDAARTFVTKCSNTMSFALHQACLGNVMTQPRAVTIRLLSRTQDENHLLTAGNEGLPLLCIIGDSDMVVKGDESVKALSSSWKNLKVVTVEGGDHMPWLAHGDRVRSEIIEWMKTVPGLPMA